MSKREGTQAPAGSGQKGRSASASGQKGRPARASGQKKESGRPTTALPALPAWRRRIYRMPVLGTIAYVIWPPRTSNSLWRRSMSSALAVVAILGLGMAAYPWVGTSYPFFYRVPVERLIEWSNVLSDLQTNRIQGELEQEFAAMTTLGLGDGDPLTRIEIPSIGVNTIVVSGTSPSALRAGAGHYPSTALPGERGNVGIAGHRTTYGRPFNEVDALGRGDLIVLTTPIGKYTYSVTRDPWITTPFDWAVVDHSDESLLTLTTCHPKGSARERLIVRAKLISSEPV
jgi:LPXTG-site transpeptidase (sortase) family protein